MGAVDPQAQRLGMGILRLGQRRDLAQRRIGKTRIGQDGKKLFVSHAGPREI